MRSFRQMHEAVKDRFQVLHRQLGAAGYAKQDPLAEQRGRLKDLHAQATSVLARVRQARAEASDATCVMAYAELVGSLQAMAFPRCRAGLVCWPRWSRWRRPWRRRVCVWRWMRRVCWRRSAVWVRSWSWDQHVLICVFE